MGNMYLGLLALPGGLAAIIAAFIAVVGIVFFLVLKGQKAAKDQAFEKEAVSQLRAASTFAAYWSTLDALRARATAKGFSNGLTDSAERASSEWQAELCQRALSEASENRESFGNLCLVAKYGIGTSKTDVDRRLAALAPKRLEQIDNQADLKEFHSDLPDGVYKQLEDKIALKRQELKKASATTAR